MRFCEAALRKGHDVDQVFFYQSGIHNASRLLMPNSDEINIYQKWCDLHDQYDVKLNVCITAAARRGVVDKELAYDTIAANLQAPFQQVGLTEYFASIADGSMSIQL
jgi:tRNA 2-thiouridine synthesizing protein D